MVREGIQRDGTSADNVDESWSRVGLVHSQHQAFNRLELALTTTPILKLANFERQFVVTTDASNATIGAILEQGLQQWSTASGLCQ